MTIAPKPGKYVVGDAQTDGHTHILYIGEHPLDMDDPPENESLTRGDFPKPTTSSFFNGYWHAHSIHASTTEDDTLICGESNESRHPHTHATITKVEE